MTSITIIDSERNTVTVDAGTISNIINESIDNILLTKAMVKMDGTVDGRYSWINNLDGRRIGGELYLVPEFTGILDIPKVSICEDVYDEDECDLVTKVVGEVLLTDSQRSTIADNIKAIEDGVKSWRIGYCQSLNEQVRIEVSSQYTMMI